MGRIDLLNARMRVLHKNRSESVRWRDAAYDANNQTSIDAFEQDIVDIDNLIDQTKKEIKEIES